MVTLGLFEPSHRHHYLLPSMAAIAQRADSDVTIFTTQEGYEHSMGTMDDAVAESCGWVLKSDDESFRAFFEQVERATTEIDVIWTITPYGPPEIAQELLTFSPHCASATLVHASSRFAPPNHRTIGDWFSFFVKSFGQYLPTPIRGRAWNQLGEYLNQHILDNYDCVLPLYPSITEYVEKIIQPDALVNWFLPEFYRPNAITNHDRLQITVPGRVTTSLRDYDLLFDVLDGMNDAQQNVRITILGRATDESGEQVIERCEHYEQSGYDIQYYPSGEWIPAEEFASRMAQTDLIFAPVNIYGEREKVSGNRVKGRTITSGAIGDAVRIGRPLMMPEEFTVAPEFEELITTYESSADATAIVESWTSSESVRQEQQRQAERAARRFSIEKQAERFESLCQQTIEAANQAH